MKARKVTNISGDSVGVRLATGNTVFLKPQQTMENVDVDDLQSIEKIVRVEYDLSEVPIKEGKQQLYG